MTNSKIKKLILSLRGKNNKAQGFVKLNEAESIQGYETNERDAGSISHEIKDDGRLNLEDNALKAIKSMQKEDISCLPVEEKDGIKGVVCRGEIIAFLKDK